ncbi:MAG: hypothetical protein EBS84_12275 [Proteobacteria bacterium]|nr:hypothetical protein [Verrucomicrobiota bacterium]NBU09775.1 hypothetical protein [Pseudomonadota bacterium]
MLSLFLLLAFSAHAQSLRLPPRPADSLAGRAVAESVTTLERPAREERLVAEVLRGNVPDFLRRLVPVSLTNTVEGTTHRVTVFVAPDYLAVGSDADYFLGPLTPGAARRIADATGCLLPSRKLVDAIHAAAPLKLNPQPIPPSKEMVTVPVFARHNEMVWEQRRAALAAHPLGTLVAGDKKDVVFTPQLATKPGKVAIYGWHRTNGVAIQPLYLGHADSWADYSHGVRLVHRSARLDGVDKAVAEILADPKLSVLLSDEAPLLGAGDLQSASVTADDSGRRLEAASTGEWRPSPHFGELVMDFKLEPGVRVHVNAPARTALAARKPTHLILYALPNGNTVEQTVGKRLAPGDDWHFNLQHIGAQTRWLREHETNATVVVAYFEAAGLSWPAWKRTNGVAKIPGYVERVAALFPNQKLTLTLNGHSGGGSFIFGFMDAHERIPASVERIAFLDSNYGYDDAKRHADKLLAWLNASPRNHLCMLAYHDSNALLNGKTFVSEEGGTWGRSHAMLAHFKRGLTFESATKDGLQTHSALVGRVKFLLKENPERKILHTVQVERNGFIHSMLTGTPAESRGYEYLGERAYEGLIQP